MPCFSPKKGFASGFTDEMKTKLKIVPYDTVGLDERGNPTKSYSDAVQTGYFEIPCGHCLGCRQDQAREWSNRLIMEMKYHDSAYFVTLTYDDMHVPVIPSLDSLTGEIVWNGNLKKSDVQMFMKRLRAHRQDDKIRFFAAGEYGPETKRPHYHAILFGLHLGDWSLIESGHSETGQIYYDCPELAKIWRNGFVSIEPANEYTCRYVCSYVTSKVGDAAAESYWQDRGQQPPFSLSSRRPGIGRQYFEDHETEFFDYEKVFIETDNGSVSVKPPRYFKKLMQASDEDAYIKIRDRHLVAMDDTDDAKTEITDLSKIEQIKTIEYNRKQKLKIRNKL